MREIVQAERTECGLACVAMIADHHGFRADLPYFRSRFTGSLKGVSLAQIIELCDRLGFSSRALRVEVEVLESLRTPCILHWGMSHFVVLERVTKNGAVIVDPARGRRTVTGEEVAKKFTGIALEITPNESFRPADILPRISISGLVGRVEGFKSSLARILFYALAIECLLLLAPLLMRTIVDEVLITSDVDLLWILLFGFTFVLVFRTWMSWIRGAEVIHVGQQFSLQWGSNLLSHLLSLPTSYFEKRSLGDIDSRFSSFRAIVRAVTTSFVESILDGTMSLLTIVAMLIISPRLTAIAIGCFMVYLAIRVMSYRKLKHIQEKFLNAAAAENSHLLESIRGMSAIKRFGMEASRAGRWQNLYVEELNESAKQQSQHLLLSSASSIINGGRDVAILGYGAWAVLNADLSLGALLAFTAYSGSFGTRATNMVDKLLDLQILKVHAERMADLALHPPEIDKDRKLSANLGEEPQRLTIRFEDVSFRYAEGEPYVLRNISFVVSAGESVAIIGPTGVGKTTLLKLILGIYEPTSGEIYVNDVPLTVFGVDRLRKISASVFQDDSLFSGSLMENICLFDDDPDLKRIEDCSVAACVHDELKSMQMGYYTVIGEMGSALSAGQRKRILLARALYRNPLLLILDETTSDLDVAKELDVNTNLRALPITRIQVAHRPETIRMADRAIELKSSK